MSPTTLCVARHGETDWNTSGILQGWIDVPINAQGRRQAREMAAAFASEGFTRVWTSPLARSLETAQIIAQALGLAPPACHDGLKERHFGAVEGVPKAQLAQSHPLLMQEILRRDPTAAFERGETMDGFADRVLGALSDIAAYEAGRRALVITHGWVMDVLTREVRGLPRSAVLDLKRKNGECIWLEASRAAIRVMADPAHPLPDTP